MRNIYSKILSEISFEKYVLTVGSLVVVKTYLYGAKLHRIKLSFLLKMEKAYTFVFM